MLKLPIKISAKQADQIVRYFKTCGYEVTRKRLSDDTAGQWTTNAPGWRDLTPLIEWIRDSRERKTFWFYVRLPEEPGRTPLGRRS